MNEFADGTIVSTAEAREYPIYMTQYHPEVVYQETAKDLDIDKSPIAYQIALELGLFMKKEMEKSRHKFDSDEQLDRIRVKNGYVGKLSYRKDFALTYGCLLYTSPSPRD